VETGVVHAGDRIMIQPIGEVVNVKSKLNLCIFRCIPRRYRTMLILCNSIADITLEEGLGTTAFAGDPVILSLQGYSDVNVLSIGCVLSDPTFPCKVATRFQTRLVTFDAMRIPLTKGFTGVMHIGTLSEQVTVKRLISQLNKGTGEVIKAKPRCLPKNCNGIVEIETLRPICIEEFK
jgi:elongation factor 1 alpha-like protein